MVCDERLAQSLPLSQFGRDYALCHSLDDVSHIDPRKVERVRKLVAFGHGLAKGEWWIARFDLGAIGPDRVTVTTQDLREVRVSLTDKLAIRPRVGLVK